MRRILPATLLGALAVTACGFSVPGNIDAGRLAPRPAQFFAGARARDPRPSDGIQWSPLRMTGDDGATEEATTAPSDVETAEASSPSDAEAADGGGGKGFSLLLLPTLLFKFAVVLCVKFATDVVVFPLLWTYRLARMGKRKVVRGVRRLLGGGGGDGLDVKVNGEVALNGDVDK